MGGDLVGWFQYCKKCAAWLDVNNKNWVYEKETKHLQPILKEITELGFLTMSSQPTSNPQNNIGIHTWQLAYVSGYVPGVMAEELFLILQKEAPDCVVYRSDKDKMVVAHDGDAESSDVGLSWSGAMLYKNPFEIDSFNELKLVPFHISDTTWHRKSLYLFEKVKSALFKSASQQINSQ